MLTYTVGAAQPAFPTIDGFQNRLRGPLGEDFFFYSAVTFRNVASQSLVYRHFHGKQSLFTPAQTTLRHVLPLPQI